MDLLTYQLAMLEYQKNLLSELRESISSDRIFWDLMVELEDIENKVKGR